MTQTSTFMEEKNHSRQNYKLMDNADELAVALDINEDQNLLARYLSRFPEDKRDKALAHALDYGILKLCDILETDDYQTLPSAQTQNTHSSLNIKEVNVVKSKSSEERDLEMLEKLKQEHATPKAARYPDWWGHREHKPSPSFHHKHGKTSNGDDYQIRKKLVDSITQTTSHQDLNRYFTKSTSNSPEKSSSTSLNESASQMTSSSGTEEKLLHVLPKDPDLVPSATSSSKRVVLSDIQKSYATIQATSFAIPISDSNKKSSSPMKRPIIITTAHKTTSHRSSNVNPKRPLILHPSPSNLMKKTSASKSYNNKNSRLVSYYPLKLIEEQNIKGQQSMENNSILSTNTSFGIQPKVSLAKICKEFLASEFIECLDLGVLINKQEECDDNEHVQLLESDKQNDLFPEQR